MGTINPKYSWENRLSFEDRAAIVDYYNKGYAVFTIMQAFKTTQTTVEYHLMKAGVFATFRKATRKGPIEIKRTPQIRSITFSVTKKLNDNKDTEQFYFDEYGEKYKKPLKKYADYLNEARRVRDIKRSNHKIKNRGAGDTFKPMIRVNLNTGQTKVYKQYSVLSSMSYC